MARKLIRDQSGMTMALAMMMIVLIGVMGAGLLTFVQSDLKSVVEVNRGQKALDIAEAGVQAAKSHLRVDSFRQHYDTVRANDCAEGIRVGGENWSKATDIYNVSTNGFCTVGQETTRAANQVGVTKNFGGGKFQVTIECFDQSGDPTGSADPCNGGAGTAPETSVPASEKKFFKITSTGYDTVAGDGAKRKVEAIYTTAKKTYAPIAFWTPKNITFNGTKCVTKMSFFAGGNITGIQPGGACGPDGTIANRTTPAIYGDWYAPPYNTTNRVNAGGASITGAGFGARGRVCGGTTCSADSNSVADGYNDYDRTTGLDSTRVAGGVGQKKKFVIPVTDSTHQITLPFDPGNAIADPSSIVDPGLVEEMRSAAAEQGNYVPPGAALTLTTWPAQGSVYFVDGRDLTFKVNQTPKAKGVIIVRNGNFDFNNASNGFEGVIIVIGNGTTTGKYTQAGGVQLDGYVAASGDIEIKGNVSPSTTIDYTNLNSFYDVKLWSWRELYQ